MSTEPVITPTKASATLQQFGGDGGSPRNPQADERAPAPGQDGYESVFVEQPADGGPDVRPVEDEVRDQRTKPEDIRDKIADRFRRQREAEAVTPLVVDDGSTAPFAPQHAGRIDENADDEDNEDAPTHAETRQDVGARPPNPAPDQPKLYTLKVNRNEVQLTREQLVASAGLTPEEASDLPETVLIRSAQIMEASKQRLAEAKQSRPVPDQEQRSAAEDEDDGPEDRGAPADPLEEAVQAIQFGTPEEGKVALRKAFQNELSGLSRQERVAKLTQETQEHIDSFAQTYSDIAADSDLVNLTFSRATEGIKDELVRIGAGTREEVEAAITSPELASRAYTEARVRGMAVRPPGEVLKDAAEHVRSRFMPQREQQPSAQRDLSARRLDEKRTLPTQPTRAAPSERAASTTTPERSSRSSAVQEMRALRGQTARR